MHKKSHSFVLSLTVPSPFTAEPLFPLYVKLCASRLSVNCNGDSSRTILRSLRPPTEAGAEGAAGEVQFKYEKESPDRTVYSGSLIITALYGRTFRVKKIIIVIIIA